MLAAKPPTFEKKNSFGGGEASSEPPLTIDKEFLFCYNAHTSSIRHAPKYEHIGSRVTPSPNHEKYRGDLNRYGELVGLAISICCLAQHSRKGCRYGCYEPRDS